MILVTGGAGFIGSHLVKALLEQGQRVRILDDLSTGKKENLEEAVDYPVKKLDGKEIQVLALGGRAEFLLGDISELSVCRLACQGVSHVFHQAALGSVQRSVENPLRTHQVNATGTLNILQAAKEAKVRRVLYASSSSVYGNTNSLDPEDIIPKEETLPVNPQSPYAVSKLCAETYCRVFSLVYGLETVAFRYFNVFGPRQDPASVYAAVVPKFIDALMNGKPPVIYGDGGQSRDFTYVENVIQANLQGMEQPGVSGQVMNVACGARASILQVLTMLQGFSGKGLPPNMKTRDGVRCAIPSPIFRSPKNS